MLKWGGLDLGVVCEWDDRGLGGGAYVKVGCTATAVTGPRWPLKTAAAGALGMLRESSFPPPGRLSPLPPSPRVLTFASNSNT